MEVWVHSPHLRKNNSNGNNAFCSRRTISVLCVIQVTLIVTISLIYLPSLSERKYMRLVSHEDGLLDDKELNDVLGLQHKGKDNVKIGANEWDSRTLMSEHGQPVAHDIFRKMKDTNNIDHRAKNVEVQHSDQTNLGLLVRTPSPRQRRKRKRKLRKKSRVVRTNKIQAHVTTSINKDSEPDDSPPKQGIKMLYNDLFDKNRELENVELLVVVSSALNRHGRRDAIRDSWFTECIKEEKVRCFFFTDDYNQLPDKKERKKLRKEKAMYGDMVFQPFGTGLLFGHRTLYQLQWAVAHFRFKFLLKVDDDVMLCLHHLLYDLKSLRSRNMQWGILHCDVPELVYIDEGVIMFTADVVKKYLAQDPGKIRCHPYGDQTVGLWIQDLGMDPYNLYVHDQRIHHNPPASFDQTLLEHQHLCNQYIALHGVYASYMSDFWSRRGYPSYLKYDEPNTSYLCDKPFVMFWDKFSGNYLHRPARCYKGDVWNATSKHKKIVHAGREENIWMPRELGLEPEPEHDKEESQNKKSWKYSEDVMDRPKVPPKIPRAKKTN